MGQIIGYAKNGHYSLAINWSETINQAANTSTLAISVVFAGNWRVTQGQAHNGTLTINGKSYGFSVPAISWPVNGGSTTIYSTSLTIPHAADGTATLTASCVYNCNLMSFADGSAALPNISCSGSQALTTIARASSISSISPNPATIGQPVGISWTPADGSYSYSLFFWVGNYSWSATGISPGSTAAYTYNWTAPDSILSAMPSSTALTYGVTLTTYNGSGAQLGQYSTTFTEQVAASVAPSISAFSVAASNPAAASSWGFVQGITSPVLSASAAPGTGSTISSYTISGAASGSYSSMPQTLGTITQSGELVYTLTVTDARGRSASKSVKITAAAYSAPTIGGLSVSRISGDDTHAQVSANWNVSPVGGKNSGSATLYWKAAGATSWTTYGTISSGTTTLDTSTVVLDEATEYNFRLILTDTAGNSAAAEQTVGTAAVLMTWNSAGNGVTFGKIADDKNLNSNWTLGAPTFHWGNAYVQSIELYDAQPRLDFHNAGDMSVDYTTRLVENYTGNLTLLTQNGGYGTFTAGGYIVHTSSGTIEPVEVSSDGSSVYLGPGSTRMEATSSAVKPSMSYKMDLGSSDRPWGRTYCDGLEIYNKDDNTPFVDFHLNNSTADYTGRIMQTDASHIGFYQPGGYINLYAIGVTNPSSRHVKHGVSDMPDPTDLLMKLRPVSFYYNSDTEDAHLQYGLIAEEAEKILPSIVDIPDGYVDEDREYDITEPVPGIDYSKLVPFLLAVIQHMEKRIEALEEKIGEK